jgi:DNA-binding XRE family transcriptional regulator
MKKDKPKLVSVPSPAIYYRLNSALAQQAFQFREGDTWPTADLTNTRKTVQAKAQIRPGKLSELQLLSDYHLQGHRQNVLQQLSSLSDLTADCLDSILILWLQSAHTPNDWATISVDEIIRMRGTTRRKIKQGWRDAIAEQMVLLTNIWLTIAEVQVPQTSPAAGPKKKTIFTTWHGESRAVHIDARFGPLSPDGELQGRVYKVKPGDLLSRYLMGPGRQTALMAEKALQWDYAKFYVEKRLVRMLAYQWRVRQSKNPNSMGKFKISSILDSIGLHVDERHPARTKERLERAMDRLLSERVIRGYRYISPEDADVLGKKGWAEAWLATLVEIDPPEEIPEHYSKIRNDNSQSRSLNAQTTLIRDLGDRLRAVRKEQGITQANLARILGVSGNWIALVERGRLPSDDLKFRIQEWLLSAGHQL